MLQVPNCFNRGCKHYLGVTQPDGTERTERSICRAYPEGIPDDIAYGDDKHLTVRPDQNNTTVFEKEA